MLHSAAEIPAKKLLEGPLLLDSSGKNLRNSFSETPVNTGPVALAGIDDSAVMADCFAAPAPGQPLPSEGSSSSMTSSEEIDVEAMIIELTQSIELHIQQNKMLSDIQKKLIAIIYKEEEQIAALDLSIRQMELEASSCYQSFTHQRLAIDCFFYSNELSFLEQKGYNLLLMSEDEYNYNEKIKMNKQPILIKMKNGSYKLWGDKDGNGRWGETELKDFKFPSHWQSEKSICVSSADLASWNALKQGHVTVLNHALLQHLMGIAFGTGCYFLLMLEDEYNYNERIKMNKQPILIKMKNGSYKLWGDKDGNGRWGETELKDFKFPSHWQFRKSIYVSSTDLDTWNTLKKGHTYYAIDLSWLKNIYGISLKEFNLCYSKLVLSSTHAICDSTNQLQQYESVFSSLKREADELLSKYFTEPYGGSPQGQSSQSTIAAIPAKKLLEAPLLLDSSGKNLRNSFFETPVNTGPVALAGIAGTIEKKEENAVDEEALLGELLALNESYKKSNNELKLHNEELEKKIRLIQEKHEKLLKNDQNIKNGLVQLQYKFKKQQSVLSEQLLKQKEYIDEFFEWFVLMNQFSKNSLQMLPQFIDRIILLSTGIGHEIDNLEEQALKSPEVHARFPTSGIIYEFLLKLKDLQVKLENLTNSLMNQLNEIKIQGSVGEMLTSNVLKQVVDEQLHRWRLHRYRYPSVNYPSMDGDMFPVTVIYNRYRWCDYYHEYASSDSSITKPYRNA